MGAPIDRTTKAALDSNLVNGITSDAPKVKGNNDTIYNYVDGLNNAIDNHAGAPTLPHADGSVVRAKLANKAIGPVQLDDLTVGQTHHQDNGIPSRALPDNVILNRHMSDNSVGHAEIQSGAVQNQHILNGVLTADKFVPGALTNDTQNALRITELSRKTSGFIALSQYCVGDGVFDDTSGFLTAISFAKSNKKSIYVDGKFLIKQGVVIENDTIPKLFGDSPNKSELIFDIDSGYALVVKTYFQKPLTINNLTVLFKNVNKTANGLKIDNGTWGAACHIENAAFKNFTGVVLNIVGGFQSIFNNVIFYGGQRDGVNVATLLKIERGPDFSNVNNFNSCGFEYGHIAIQNLGGINYTFEACQFEHLDLFMHTPNLSGLSLRNNFNHCWFELIEKGVLNADINESTLTPLLPVSNKANLMFLEFDNNYAGPGCPAIVLNPDIEPERYDQFLLETGFGVSVKKQAPFITATNQNGWTGTIQYAKNSLGMVTLMLTAIKPGTTTALTTIATLPVNYRPVENVAIPLTDAPDGGVRKFLFLDTGGNLRIPSASDFTQPYSYKSLITFYAG